MGNKQEIYSIRKFKNGVASTKIKSKLMLSLMGAIALVPLATNVSNAQQGLGNLGPWMQGIPADAEHFVEFEFNFSDCYIINKYPAGTFKFLKDKPVGQAVPVNVYTGNPFEANVDFEKIKSEIDSKGYANLIPTNLVDVNDDKIFVKKLADGTELLQYTVNAPEIKKYYENEPFKIFSVNNYLTLRSEEAEQYIETLKSEGEPVKTKDGVESTPFKIVVEERGGENSLAETGVPYKFVPVEFHGETVQVFSGDTEKLKEMGLLDNKTVIYEYPLVDFSEEKEIRFADFSIPKGYELTKEEILSYMTTTVPNIDKTKINITEKEEYRTEGGGMDLTTVRVDRDYLTFTDNNSYSKNETGRTTFIATYTDELGSDVYIREINVSVVDGETKTVAKHYPTHNLKDINRPCVIKPLSMDEGNEYIKVPNTYPTWEMPSIEIPEIPNTPPNTTDNEGTPPLPPEPDPEPERESTHPNTYPTWELPEAKIEEIPPVPPTTTDNEDEPDPDPEPDKESRHPNTYPTWELPEAKVEEIPPVPPTTTDNEDEPDPDPEPDKESRHPNTYPTYELPEAILDFKIPNTYPTWEMPSIEFPTEPTPPPVIPEDKIEIPPKENEDPTPKEKELPKTNTTTNSLVYTATALIGLATLLRRKQQ